MRFSKILFIILLVAIQNAGFAQNKIHKDNIDSLISIMTQSEKIDFIAGYQNFNIKGNPRLGIPQIKMADGPMGLNGHGKATAFPASICMAATWNTTLIQEVGEAIAMEAKSKGIGVLLAPGANNYRIPQCGRNFEYYGEDPFLCSEMAVSFINGVQSKKVIATIKHFVANNHDYDRHRVSSDIDERTLNEIYFPPFKAAVQKAKVGAIMTSYNLVNGVHTSESKVLMEEVLRKQWGFDGIIMSDWISVYSIDAFAAGLDIEMPRPQFMNHHNIDSLIEANPENIDLLDQKVKRIISTCESLGLYDTLNFQDIEVDIKKHEAIAQQVAREGIVLLKNEDNILPLENHQPKKILVIGPNAKYTPYSGGGAAHIDASHNISFFQGIKNIAPEHFQIDYLSSEGLFLMNSKTDLECIKKELSIAKDYDALILCLGFNSKTEGEAFDRPFSLPEKQLFLMDELAKIQDHIILVINAGGGISMPWVDKTKVILHAWYLGQEGGNALAEVLFGKVNPSGKLPISIERKWEDNAAFSSYDSTHALAGAKPFYTLYGKKHKSIPMEYTEGIFTGYRHYEKENIKPLFAFGYGISYTQFKLSALKIKDQNLSVDDSLHIQFTIKNIGDREGSETIQLYVSDQSSSLPRPEKELKGFKKVFLKAGETKTIKWSLPNEILSVYHSDHHQWMIEDGAFEIKIGNASNHITLKESINYHQ